MSLLHISSENAALPAEILNDPAAITAALKKIGVLFERWDAETPLSADADGAAILEAYQTSVDRLIQYYGFQSADVIRLTPEHPDRCALRAKFLDEHTHSEFEVRFFVEGQGLFYLHPDDKVYAVLCEKGDLISVPDGVKHWFDMGENPSFTCIRLFTSPEGWVAQYTGDGLAKNFPTLEAFKEGIA